MKIKLNQNLHGHKKGEVIDLKLCSTNDARYWRKSIKDSKIDKSVSVITDKELKKEKEAKLKEKKKKNEEAKKELNKKEVENDTVS